MFFFRRLYIYICTHTLILTLIYTVANFSTLLIVICTQCLRVCALIYRYNTLYCACLRVFGKKLCACALWRENYNTGASDPRERFAQIRTTCRCSTCSSTCNLYALTLRGTRKKNYIYFANKQEGVATEYVLLSNYIKQ